MRGYTFDCLTSTLRNVTTFTYGNMRPEGDCEDIRNLLTQSRGNFATHP